MLLDSFISTFLLILETRFLLLTLGFVLSWFFMGFDCHLAYFSVVCCQKNKITAKVLSSMEISPQNFTFSLYKSVKTTPTASQTLPSYPESDKNQLNSNNNIKISHLILCLSRKISQETILQIKHKKILMRQHVVNFIVKY